MCARGPPSSGLTEPKVVIAPCGTAWASCCSGLPRPLENSAPAATASSNATPALQERIEEVCFKRALMAAIADDKYLQGYGVSTQDSILRQTRGRI
jgi:hypothetical protein